MGRKVLFRHHLFSTCVICQNHSPLYTTWYPQTFSWFLPTGMYLFKPGIPNYQSFFSTQLHTLLTISYSFEYSIPPSIPSVATFLTFTFKLPIADTTFCIKTADTLSCSHLFFFHLARCMIINDHPSFVIHFRFYLVWSLFPFALSYSHNCLSCSAAPLAPALMSNPNFTKTFPNHSYPYP